MHVFINIGSNLGDRRRNLSRAVSAIEKEFGYFELSHVVESEPWGYESDNPYLNVGMMVISDKAPLEILEKLQAIEKSMDPSPHRDPEGNYKDRTIDIDIIAIDDLSINTMDLTVPHPRMHRRRFVLEPLCELAPFWRHPHTGLTPREMLDLIP